MTATCIGLLAGQGDLPVQVVNHCLESGIPFFIVAFEGQTSPELVQQHPHIWVQHGEIGKILARLKHHNITHIIMAGAMRRPSRAELKLDWKGIQWLARIGMNALGDDGLLQNIISLLESEGFKVISPAELLQNILMPEALLSLAQPDETDWQDINRGRHILQSLGVADVGQAVVIQQGLVLGIEAIEGTKALLERCGLLRREGRGATLVKMAKPQQTLKVDLPTIGLETVCQAQAAGLRGIALGAHSAQILDRQSVIEKVNSTGLYLVGIPPL